MAIKHERILITTILILALVITVSSIRNVTASGYLDSVDININAQSDEPTIDRPVIRIEPPVGTGVELHFTETSSTTMSPVESAQSQLTTTFSGNPDDLEINYQSGRLIHSVVDNYDLFEVEDDKSELEGKPHQPLLPVSYLHLAVPPESRYIGLDLIELSSRELSGKFSIHPAPESEPLCSGGGNKLASTSKPTIFTEGFEPETSPMNPVAYVDTVIIRGQKFLIFRISPIRYVPDTGTVTHHEQIRFSPILSFDDPIDRSYGAPTKVFSNLLEKFSDNPIELSTDDAVDNPQALPLPNVEYLIITNNALENSFQFLADWKSSRGVPAEILTTEYIYGNYSGSDNQEQIKNAIIDYAQNHNTVWVLLGGDDTIVPDRDCYANVDNKYFEYSIPTDLYYAGLDDLDWDDDPISPPCDPYSDTVDLGPDIFIGRAPVRTSAGADAFIQKVKSYVEEPPPNDFAEDMILMGERLWNEWDGKSDSHWRSEELYNTYIDPYWDPVRLRLYDTGTDFGGAGYAFSAAHVSDQINDGYNFLFMSTHGNQLQWAMEVTPHFSATDAFSLTNQEAEGIIYTIACFNNFFDDPTYDPCLSEAFVRNPNGGAVAFIGSTRYGWGNSDPVVDFGTSFQFASQFYQQLFSGSLSTGGGVDPNDYPNTLGAVHTSHKLHFLGLSSDNNEERWLQFGLSLVGDPQMEILTQDTHHFSIHNDGTRDLWVLRLAVQNNSPWLTMTPPIQTPFRIAPGGSISIPVTVDGAGLSPGTYNERILVYSSDWDKSPYPAGDPDDTDGGVDVELKVHYPFSIYLPALMR